MAFDFTKLTGYIETMTADEKLALLDTYEAPAPDLTGYIKKSTFDNTASELAEVKRKLKDKMTEDELKEAERATKEAEKDELLKTLMKDKTISTYETKYLGLGFDSKLAKETAQAQADGDMEKVFANQALHLENVKKATLASALSKDKTPPPGSGATLNDKEKLIQQYNEAEKNKNFVLMSSLLSQIKKLEK
jgi:hypothetical protein